ncbi:MAG: hypothetical protein BWY57_02134 [Betaproteobacteria bacterium ADurb.Bin341]|nr:MAG: hypothetical protein BWY57_02134 [Betaproteobacteria bacterium ADurb.Bin341]
MSVRCAREYRLGGGEKMIRSDLELGHYFVEERVHEVAEIVAEGCAGDLAARNEVGG